MIATNADDTKTLTLDPVLRRFSHRLSEAAQSWIKKHMGEDN